MKNMMRVLAVMTVYICLSANGECGGGDDTGEIVTKPIVQPGDILKGYIRNGFKIKCRGNPAFQRAVANALSLIEQSVVGRELYEQLRSLGVSEALTVSFGGSSSSNYEILNGQYTGDVSRIQIGTLHQSDPLNFTLDTSLFHELTHALHHYNGTLRDLPMNHAIPQVDWGLIEEEYFTTGIPFDLNGDGKVSPRRLIDGEGLDRINENAYRQEKGYSLRKTYRIVAM